MSGDDVSLRDATSGRKLATTKELLPPWGMDFAPDGKTVAITTGVGIAFWSPDEKEPLPKLEFREAAAAPAYSPDGTRVAVGSHLRFGVLDPATMKPAIELPRFDYGL